MIERDVAGKLDDHLRIETGDFDPRGDQLRAPGKLTIGIEAEPDVPTYAADDRCASWRPLQD